MKITIWVNIDKSGYGYVSELQTPYNNTQRTDPPEGYRQFEIEAEIPMIIVEKVKADSVKEVTPND